jgi:uncharacterized protein Yka (UPF0111/DUF47 family)
VADGENLQAAASRLREMVERFDRLEERVAEIQRLEKVGDDLDVIKWRDLYREMENTIDAAEDAAEAIERMYHKAT